MYCLECLSENTVSAFWIAWCGQVLVVVLWRMHAWCGQVLVVVLWKTLEKVWLYLEPTSAMRSPQQRCLGHGHHCHALGTEKEIVCHSCV